jgi:hypothetical protein
MARPQSWLHKNVFVKVKGGLAVRPKLFVTLYRLFGPKRNQDLLIGSKTQIVIEGFPRSANTFSVIAFQQAGNHDAPIAHHLHAEAQILSGVSRGIPVIVLIREPESAIRSLIVRHPETSAHKALNLWLRFYGIVENVREHVVISEFKETTENFGAIIRAVNEKYGTTFQVFDNSEASVAEVFSEIDKINKRQFGGASNMIARPMANRENAKKMLSLDVPEDKLLRAKAMFTHLSGTEV